MGLLAVGAASVLLTMVYGLQLDGTNRETSAASRGARAVLEQIRAEDLADVLTLYNADASDDPDGAGSAPGDAFGITFLERTAGATSPGSVVLPFDTDGVVRETADLPELGFPRDLNGDGVLDADDRSADLLVLPVIVRVRWDGVNGERVLAYRTVLR